MTDQEWGATLLGLSADTLVGKLRVMLLNYSLEFLKFCRVFLEFEVFL